MNGLSWVIYGAEALGGLKFSFGMIAVLGGIGGAISLLFSPMAGDTLGVHGEDERKEVRSRPKEIRKFVYSKVFPAVFVLSILASLIPSSKTIYLIGASQAGEHILQLQEVQEIGGEAGALATDTIRLLRQMVSDQLESEQ